MKDWQRPDGAILLSDEVIEQFLPVVIIRMFRIRIVRRILTALILTSAEAFLAIMAIITGIPILLNPYGLSPNSVIVLLPAWGIYAWAALVTVGGFATIFGIIFQRLRLERIGVLALAATTNVFAMALIAYLPRSFIVLVIFVLFTLAMAARYWALGVFIKIINDRGCRG